MKRLLPVLYCIFFSFQSHSQPGSLDHTFNGIGKVFTSFYYDYGNGFEIGGDDVPAAMAIQPDGKIIVAGITYTGTTYDVGLARYNISGSLDNSFGFQGLVNTDFNNGGQEGAAAVAIQPDGKIVVALTSQVPVGDFALIRYNTDGSLDNTFDTDAKVTTDFGDVDVLTCMAIQPDGKIVVAGYSLNSGDVDFSLARYNGDGSLDLTFGIGGKLLSAFSPRTDEIHAMIIQPDGKILVAGHSYDSFVMDFALARYNPDGTPDNSFDGDGKVITSLGPLGNTATTIALQPDGKIVAGGYSPSSANNDFTLIRYNINGSLDNTFDTDGKVSTPIGPSHDIITSVSVQTDGKIIAAGYSRNGLFFDFSLAKYNANGSLDNSFDGDGKVLTDINNEDDIAVALKLSGDRIYVAGSTHNSTGFTYFTLVAFQNSLPLVLPLHLLSFNATIQQQSVDLLWKTASEQNTSHFIIERSTDGISFSSIGTVVASPINSPEKNYAFTDRQPLAGTNFYRLKMTDADSRFSYSRIVAVKMNAANKWLLFPVPVNDILHIQTKGLTETALLSIVDLAGKTLIRSAIQFTGNNSFTVDVQTLPKGNYYVVLQLKQGKEIQGFVKN